MKTLGFAIAFIGAVAFAFQHLHYHSDVLLASDATEFESAVANTKHGRRLNIPPVRFYAMGDAPYSNVEKENLPLQIAMLDESADFAVHLGDMQDRTPQCRPGPYADLSKVLKGSKIPMFILPGDNCYYDCVNWQEGFQYWTNTFHGFHEHWSIPFDLRIQPVRQENFAITTNRVLFVGIHTLWTRKIKNQEKWQKLENENLNWVQNQLTNFAYNGKVDAVVILAHSYTRKSLYRKFNDFLSDHAIALGLPFLFLQGDAHRFRQDTPFAAKNILRTVVDRGGIADPVLVTVDLSRDNPFLFEHRELSGM